MSSESSSLLSAARGAFALDHLKGCNMGNTQWSYWNGPDEVDRREVYAADFRPQYQTNGDDLQRRVAAVETAFRAEAGAVLPGGWSSGWRSPEVNDSTQNAGKASTHLTANGGDLRDTPDGTFVWWCMRNQHILAVHGLYMEHPVATVVRAWRRAEEQQREPTPWCHLQSLPPKSHHRVYFPDSGSLQEWEDLQRAGGYAGMDYAAWLGLKRPAVISRGPRGRRSDA